MKRIKHILILVLLIAGGMGCYAQNPDLNSAYDCVNRNNMDSARLFIDKAITDAATRKDADFWYVRGFIYKELYKKYELAKRLTVYRDTAIADFFKSAKLDTSAANKKTNYGLIKYLASRYQNDAVEMLDTLHYLAAKKYYARSKEINKTVDPSIDFSTYDLQFNLQLGDVYSALFSSAVSDDAKKAFLDSAKKAYNVALAINPNNVTANYQLAILYYNQAINIINKGDFDEDITKINVSQDTSIHLALASLPFMEKTHQLDPNRKSALVGLEGIYYMLHDDKKFQEYETELNSLDNQK